MLQKWPAHNFNIFSTIIYFFQSKLLKNDLYEVVRNDHLCNDVISLSKQVNMATKQLLFSNSVFSFKSPFRIIRFSSNLLNAYVLFSRKREFDRLITAASVVSLPPLVWSTLYIKIPSQFFNKSKIRFIYVQLLIFGHFKQ